VRFRRRDREPARRAENPFPGLRNQILTLDPLSVGLDADRTGPIWGAMVETGIDRDVATLVCLADGTTSLYTSSGWGIIGGGAHEAVVAATQTFLATFADFLPDLTLEEEPALPGKGQVVLRALTHQGRFAFGAPEADLGHGRSPLSPAFHAAHAVITELRLINEERQ
jgi:hypothetical protein